MSSEQKRRVQSFFDGLASSYDTVIPFFETFAARLVEVVGIGPEERVLDLACGTGRCTRAAAGRTGPGGLVVGTDLALAMVEQAAAHLGVEHGSSSSSGSSPIRLAVADAEHLGLRDSSVDVVTCGFGVFFFPDPLGAVAGCHRVLSPGGRFAATTFADGFAGYRWADEVNAVLGHGRSLPPSRVLTHDGLEAVLDEAGFVDVVTTTVEGRFVFADVDRYLAWCWSTGSRRVLTALTDDQLDRYRSLSAERLAAHAVDGGYELRQPANVTVGHRR